MGRKVFLSFLGTNNYLNCNYFEEGNPENKVSDVKYVQEALIKMFCQDFQENDVVLLFLTEKAEHMNFWDNGQYNRATDKYDSENEGLHARLLKLNKAGQQFSLSYRRIKEGFSQDEIWSIFETIADEIQEEDQIIFDITHAFRFLPMMGIVLMNYLKATKKVTVEGVHYGAFEKLGPQAVVSSLNVEDRNAPIINLNTLLEFQSWTSAVNNFVKFGEIGGLRDLSQPQLKSILTDTKGRDVSASNLRLIIEELSKVTQYLQTNRLNILLEYDFSLFTQRLQATSDDTVAIKPFKQVLGLVQKKVANLVDAKDLIWLQSAKWCLEHNLIQQSYTQLQEGLLTFFTHLLNEELSGNPLLSHVFDQNSEIYPLSPKKEKHRRFVSDLLHALSYASQSKENVKTSPRYLPLLVFFQKSKYKEISSLYSSISELRNDINHAGMREKVSSADSLSKKIRTKIQKTEALIITLTK